MESKRSVSHSGPLRVYRYAFAMGFCGRNGSRLDQDRDSIIAHHLISVDICPTALVTPAQAENGRI
jgi:hypothetical protein